MSSDIVPSHSAPQVPLARRFHIRVSLLLAIPVFAILVVAGYLDYRRGVDSEIGGLQKGIMGLAVSLSHSIDAAVVSSFTDPSDSGRPEYRALVDRFARIAAEQNGVESIYLFAPTDEPGVLRFVADWALPDSGATARIGDPYDASRFAEMLAGFNGPSVESEVAADQWGLTLSGYAPIRDAGGVAVAIVGVDVAADRVSAVKREVLLTTLVLFGIAGLLLAVTGALVGRWVRVPIGRIVKGTEEIAAGRLDTRIDLARQDELGLVGRRFDEMAAGLEERERIRATFGRYVSEEVARRVLASPEAANLGGEERDVSIVFSDIKGYSTIAEQLPPTQVVDILNRYLGEMGELIDEHDGCVIEFIGDAILAVFGAPEHCDQHVERAVVCAREMERRLDELNREWEAEGLAEAWQQLGLDELTARIGVHTGHVVAGNMGSATRIKYGVCGDAVNVAARVEALNKDLGTSLLVTADVHRRLPPEMAAEAVDHGAHPVKGRDELVEVYGF